MKVLHIMLSAKNGGAETHFADTVLALHKDGVEQVVVANPASLRYAELKAAGVKMVLSQRWQAKSVIPAWFIRRAIRREKPDVIQCWMRRAASLTPRTKTPTIGWFGGYYDPKYFGCCDDFIGVTRGITAHMVEKGVGADHAYFVNTFSSADNLPPVSRADLNTPADAPVLLTLSRIHIKKGIDTTLMALTQLPTCYLWVAGDGPLEAEMKALAVKLGVADRVRFLGWRSDRGALLRAADICLLPSRYEPFGTVILEAWQVGRPLVTCAAAGPRETVHDGEDALMVPIDDDQALAHAVRRVLEEDGLRDRLVAGGLALYHKEYTADVTVSKLKQIYAKVISNKK